MPPAAGAQDRWGPRCPPADHLPQTPTLGGPSPLERRAYLQRTLLCEAQAQPCGHGVLRPSLALLWVHPSPLCSQDYLDTRSCLGPASRHAAAWAAPRVHLPRAHRALSHTNTPARTQVWNQQRPNRHHRPGPGPGCPTGLTFSTAPVESPPNHTQPSPGVQISATSPSWDAPQRQSHITGCWEEAEPETQRSRSQAPAWAAPTAPPGAPAGRENPATCRGGQGV